MVDRIGQTLNLSALGADAGVSHTTAREWLSVLEASYIAFRWRPHVANTRKCLTKSLKIYFHDVGLVAFVLGVNDPAQITTHPLKGALFENAAVIEILKHHHNRGMRPNLTFYRDSQGLECDLLWRSGNEVYAFEMKSGTTINSILMFREIFGLSDPMEYLRRVNMDQWQWLTAAFLHRHACSSTFQVGAHRHGLNWISASDVKMACQPPSASST